MSVSTYWIERCNDLDAKNRALRAEIERLQALIDAQSVRIPVSPELRSAVERMPPGEIVPAVHCDDRGMLRIDPEGLSQTVDTVLADYVGGVDVSVRDAMRADIVRRLRVNRGSFRKAA